MTSDGLSHLLYCADPALADAAQTLASRHGLRLLITQESAPPSPPLTAPKRGGRRNDSLREQLLHLGSTLQGGCLLVLDADGLSLCNPEDPAERMRADFCAGRTGYRLGTHANTSQPILKAIGFRDGTPLTVFDATAGLGGDGMLMACAGCRVILCERSAVMAALLDDALGRAQADPELGPILRERVELVCGDAREILPTRAAELSAVYLDPMFPPRQKSALVKKEMRLAKLAAGEDPDAAELLEIARRHVRRVVVKRPAKAEELGPGVRRIVDGRSIRFDLYES